MTDSEARRCIRDLRAGVVTPETARAVTAGTSTLIASIRAELASFARGDRGSHLIFLRGDWGFGKSHVRALCEYEIGRIGAPYICGWVDGRDRSLAHLNRCVPGWLNSLQIGNLCGLPAAVTYDHFDPAAVLEWCRKSGTAFADGVRLALMGSPRGWLLATGEWYSWPDYGYQHPKALAIVHAAADFIQAMTGSGIVLLLDEVENITREWDIRGRKKCYEVLMDLAKNANMLLGLFVTDRFFHQVTEDQQRGQREGWDDGQLGSFFRLVKAANVFDAPALDRNLARALVRKIAELYSIAYGRGAIDEDQVLSTWYATPTRSPRLLIRQTIHLLDLDSA